MAWRRDGLARLHRRVDRCGAGADKIRIVGTGLSQCRSAVDAVAEGPGGGYRSDPPARFYAADAAEPAEPGATRPADRSGHRSYQRRAKRGAVQAIGERCLGRAGNAEPADDILS